MLLSIYVYSSSQNSFSLNYLQKLSAHWSCKFSTLVFTKIVLHFFVVGETASENVMSQSKYQCLKSVQIRSFFLVRILLYSARIQENMDQEKLRIWTLFTQCTLRALIYILWVCLLVLIG